MCIRDRYYDLIVTGDLGSFGSKLLFEICSNQGVNIKENFLDCGCLIYDGLPDTYCGGSGCGCSAITLNGYLTVSYTHLDVYKRQAVYCCRWIF